MTKGSIWSKITKLDEKFLRERGVEVIREQKPIKNETESKEKNYANQKKEEEPWLPQISEGKLSLDVYLEDKNIVVLSAIAGVKREDLEIIIDRDILTIKGERKREKIIDKKNYLHQECFWGHFSRTIILPCEVKVDEVEAKLKNGILTIILPKKEETKEIKRISPRIKIESG